MVLFALAFSTLLSLQLSSSATSTEIFRWEGRGKPINKERKDSKKKKKKSSRRFLATRLDFAIHTRFLGNCWEG